MLEVLVTQKDLLVKSEVRLVDFGCHPRRQEEVLVTDQEVVLEVETLAAGELLPKIDTELVK